MYDNWFDFVQRSVENSITHLHIKQLEIHFEIENETIIGIQERKEQKKAATLICNGNQWTHSHSHVSKCKRAYIMSEIKRMDYQLNITRTHPKILANNDGIYCTRITY